MVASRITAVIVSLHGIGIGKNSVTLVWTVWSNFEIASLEFWRSEAYSKYFDFLEATGGFYYEVHLVKTLSIPSHANRTSFAALGRRTSSQHRCLTLPSCRPDSLLQ